MINKIFNEECLSTIRRMSDNSLDGIITSPHIISIQVEVTAIITMDIQI